MVITFGIGQSHPCLAFLPSIFPATACWFGTNFPCCLIRPDFAAFGLRPGRSFPREMCLPSLHYCSLYLMQSGDMLDWILFAAASHYAPGRRRNPLSNERKSVTKTLLFGLRLAPNPPDLAQPLLDPECGRLSPQ